MNSDCPRATLPFLSQSPPSFLTAAGGAPLERDDLYLLVLSPATRGEERPVLFSDTFLSLCPQTLQGWQLLAQWSPKGPPGPEGQRNQGVGVWPHCQESGVKERYSFKCQPRKGLPECLQPNWTMDGQHKFPLAPTKDFKLQDGCQHLKPIDCTF